MTIERTKWIAGFAIVVGVATWALDMLHLVEPCGYCRVQRSVIGLLGILLLLPIIKHWLVQWVAKTIAALGIVVAATQHFLGWNEISKGDFVFDAPLYANHYLHFLLSAGALFIIVALLMIIERGSVREDRAASAAGPPGDPLSVLRHPGIRDR